MQPLFDLLIQRRPRIALRVFRQRQCQAHREHARRIGADVHPVHGEKAAHHERGAGQQHECQRHLRDNQRRRPAAGADAAGARSPTRFLHHLVHVGLRDVQRWRQAEEERGGDADASEKTDDQRIEREGHPVRLAERRIAELRVQRADPRISQREAADAADRGEQKALDQQLTDDPPAACAEGDADGDLARSLRGSPEQQVRDVRAGDQQHESNGA